MPQRRRQGESQKGNRLKRIGKATTLHVIVHHAFLYIFFTIAAFYDRKMPNFTFYGGRKEATAKLSFSASGV